MKNVLFVRLAPEGNFMYDGKSYANGDVLADIPDEVADSIIEAKLAIDPSVDPKFTAEIKNQIQKDSVRRDKIIDKVESRKGVK